MKSIALIAAFCSLTIVAGERKLSITNNCPDVMFTAYYKNCLGLKDHSEISPRTTLIHSTTSESIVLSWSDASLQERIAIDHNTKIVIQQAIAIKLRDAQPPIYRILHPERKRTTFYQALKEGFSSSSSLASSSESSNND